MQTLPPDLKLVRLGTCRKFPGLAKYGENSMTLPDPDMEASVRKFFVRYENFFNCSLAGETEMKEGADLYASEFIAASPSGVMTAKNDSQLRQVMTQGYARYRAMGTKEMRIRDIRLSPLDDLHCVAHVAWTAIYTSPGQPDIPVDFDVHYFVQRLGGEPKVFGWVSGDEQALLRGRGII
jgi:hypothetical protein